MPAPLRTIQTPAGTAIIFAEKDRDSAARVAADMIRSAVDAAGARRGKAVLGLATGSTPIPVYAELVKRHREGDLRFNGVVSYNLDEYYPINPRDPNSYCTFMYRHLFSHIEIAPNQTHVLDGTVPEAAAAEHCAQFERWIVSDGGLDLQLLGLGRNGHIGFNEPSTLSVEQALALRTRVIALHPTTTADAARDFGGDAALVPRRALTLGIATILEAREILVLALGAAKSEAVARSLGGPVTAEVPGSLLQTAAKKVTWILDEAAAAGVR